MVIAAGSLLDFEGDAIVNAANQGGSGGFGIDELVNRAGGYELKEARKQFGTIDTGTAKYTQSYEHKKVKYIIHTVGPVYRIPFTQRFQTEEEKREFLIQKDPLLEQAYQSSLQLAKELQVETLGFSLLSAGVFRGERSLEDILLIGLRSVMKHTPPSLKEVTLVCWTQEEQDCLVKLLHQEMPSQ
uniref:Macro domain-containing protein n=1 Tax=Arcella intermedia TaxID=1963864 RepID=A0A6B2LKD1_9EUKA